MNAPARVVGRLGLSLCLVLGCAGGEPKAAGLGPDDTGVATLLLSLSAPAVDAGQSVLIRATGRTALGAAAPVSVHWTATRGNIVSVSDSAAEFSAATAGTYWVSAQEVSAPAVVDSVSIVVVTPVSPTVGIAVLPASASMTTGASRQFSATATRADGTTYTPGIEWSATGGTISQGGLFSAGSTTGTFRVVGRQQGGSLADTSTVTLTAAPPVLQAVILTPSIASLETGGTQQFTVSGQWSNGSTTAPAVTYSATGGSVTQGGLYTAGNTSGTFRVIARQQGGTLADTSSVSISTSTLTGCTVSPGSVTLAPGQAQQFTAVGQLSNGTTSTPQVTYSAGGGSITSSGLYTAGTVAGTYQVSAAVVGTSFTCSSQVIVETAPPPPPGLGQIPELPAGYTLYRLHSGSPLVPSGWSMDGTSITSLQTDATAPRSPSDVLRITYPAGFAAGGEPAKFWFAMPSTTGVFVTYWIKYNTHFVGHSSGINKHIFSIMDGMSDWTVVSDFSGDATTMTVHATIQIPGFSGGALVIGDATSVPKDQWCRISFEALANGTARVWVNGILQGTGTGIPWIGFPGEFQIAPTWGGVGGAVPNTQWFELDEVGVYLR